jgi:hypothetical protein
MPASPFQTEAWIEYGLGTLVLLLRYFARWKTVGFKGYQGDDYFALVSLIFWTVCFFPIRTPFCLTYKISIGRISHVGTHWYELFDILSVGKGSLTPTQVKLEPTLALPTRWVPRCQLQKSPSGNSAPNVSLQAGTFMSLSSFA